MVDFDAFEWVRTDDYIKDSTAGKRWVSSRWEDRRKDSGELRSRWVLRDFATTNAESEFFAATPHASCVEMVHVRALKMDHDIAYFDLTRAFYHAPELDCVYADPPEGWREEGWCWKLKKKIPGSRNGSQSFVEWFASGLIDRGFRRLALEPSMFVSEEKSLEGWGGSC